MVRIARPFSSTERSRLPLGFSARRAMFVRCEKGRVCDFELYIVSNATKTAPEAYILDKIEHSHPVADRRQQTRAIWCEEQVASAVDGTKQIGELVLDLVRFQSYSCGREAYLEVSLHRGGLQRISDLETVDLSQRGVQEHHLEKVQDGWPMHDCEMRRRASSAISPFRVSACLPNGRRAERGQPNCPTNTTPPQHSPPTTAARTSSDVASSTHLFTSRLR